MKVWLLVVLVALTFIVTSCEEGSVSPPIPSYGLTVYQYDVAGMGIVDGALVTDLISHDGESRDDFITRTARVLHAFSTSTNYEACGRFAISERDGESKLAIRIWTNLSHKGCLITYSAPSGFIAVGEHIHSHPVHTPVVFNHNDEVLSGRAFLEGMSVDLIIDEFSAADYAAGPGYLVTRNRLLYQNSKKRSRVVASL